MQYANSSTLLLKIMSDYRMPGRNMSSYNTRHKVCPIVFGFVMRAHIIQIVGSVDEMALVPLLACEIE